MLTRWSDIVNMHVDKSLPVSHALTILKENITSVNTDTSIIANRRLIHKSENNIAKVHAVIGGLCSVMGLFLDTFCTILQTV